MRKLRVVSGSAFVAVSTQSAAFTACGGCVLSAKANIQDALVGVNYKF